MKNILYNACLLCTISNMGLVCVANDRVIVDKIVARVNGVNILKSDLDTPRINTENGRPFTLQEAVMEELTVQHAASQHMLPTSLDIERQIAGFKIQNGLQDMTEEEFDAQLKDGGLTLKAYKQQIGRRITVENVKRAEIYEKIVVSSQEVETYCKQHPEYTKEAYHIEICTMDKNNTVSDPKGNDATWEKLDWIDREDLSKDLECVLTMKKGDISAPLPDSQNPDRVTLVKVIEKRERRLKTVNERYGQVDRLLQQNKRIELSQNMENELMNRAIISYF